MESQDNIADKIPISEDYLFEQYRTSLEVKRWKHTEGFMQYLVDSDLILTQEEWWLLYFELLYSYASSPTINTYAMRSLNGEVYSSNRFLNILNTNKDATNPFWHRARVGAEISTISLAILEEVKRLYTDFLDDNS